MQKKRLLYIDNIRAGLMILVILQHAVRAYGSTVWWFVRDAQASLLERFTAVNSSFFMSLFFFISFYFIPPSYDRKSFGAFHRDRLLRLFFPLIVYVAFISAGMMYAHFCFARSYGDPGFLRYYRDFFLGLGGKPSDWSGPAWPDMNFGHLWFVEHLLLYGIVYSLVRLVVTRFGWSRKRELPFPSNRVIAAVGVALALVSFAVRFRYPLYRWVGVLGFIQAELGHMPFYLTMFLAGILAYRNDWLSALPGKAGTLWFRVGAVSAVAIALFPVSSESFGGGSLLSLAYAVCESFCCLGFLIGIPYWAWRLWNVQTPALKALTDNSYAMYILHMPVVVGFQYLVAGLAVSPYLKFALVSILSIPATFMASTALRKIPLIARYV